jgi:hypothetical protein
MMTYKLAFKNDTDAACLVLINWCHLRYNFNNEGVIATHKNVLAYILCISVVDHEDVTVDEIVYLASEFAGDATEQYEVSLPPTSSLFIRHN